MAKKVKSKWTHKVKEVRPHTRMSDYCGKVFSILGSKSATKKAIASGRILINGQIATTADYVNTGDIITLKGTGVKKIKKLDIDLPIIFQDDFLILVNKPGGIAVNGNRYKTVENALANINSNNPLPDALPRPVAVHRIDVPTNGIVMLAKTKSALILLSKAFQQKKVQKEYVAIVHGKPPAKGTITEPIQGKKSVTEFICLKTVPSRVFGQLSLVKLLPITGRTHQLRIHMNNAGYCIVGDKQYGTDIKTISGKGLLLCARKISFTHPKNNKILTIEIDIPNKFTRILERENKRFD